MIFAYSLVFGELFDFSSSFVKNIKNFSKKLLSFDFETSVAVVVIVAIGSTS